MRSLLIVCSKSDEAFPGILIEGSGLYRFFIDFSKSSMFYDSPNG